jgi:DNA replication initiation complex subunit (GINS family)
MMYDTLHETWRREKENDVLQELPDSFYAETVEYVKRIRREARMLEAKSIKARLMAQELANAERMVKELVSLRFEKLVKRTSAGELPNSEALTSREREIALELRPAFEKLQTVLKDSRRGRTVASDEKPRESRRLLRFLKEVPAIVGADLKMYGPFAAEDVATLPAENARVLVKHGVAMEVETE